MTYMRKKEPGHVVITHIVNHLHNCHKSMHYVVAKQTRSPSTTRQVVVCPKTTWESLGKEFTFLND